MTPGALSQTNPYSWDTINLAPGINPNDLLTAEAYHRLSGGDMGPGEGQLDLSSPVDFRSLLDPSIGGSHIWGGNGRFTRNEDGTFNAWRHTADGTGKYDMVSATYKLDPTTGALTRVSDWIDADRTPSKNDYIDIAKVAGIAALGGLGVSALGGMLGGAGGASSAALGNGAFLGEGVASGIGAWDTAAGLGAELGAMGGAAGADELIALANLNPGPVGTAMEVDGFLGLGSGAGDLVGMTQPMTPAGSFIPGVDSAGSGWIGAATPPSSVDLGSLGGVMSTGSGGIGGALSRFGDNAWNAITNFGGKLADLDPDAWQKLLTGVGAVGSYMNRDKYAPKSAAELRSQIINPAYDNWTEQQQESFNNYFNKPLPKFQYKPPNVGGIVQLRDGGRPEEPRIGTKAPPRRGGTGGGLSRAAVQEVLQVPPPRPPERYGVGNLPADPLRNPRAIVEDRLRRAEDSGALTSYASGGQADNIPARLSPGEYVIDADVVSALGDGDNNAGAAVLDAMRENIRLHKRSAPPDKIPPPAKSVYQYMKKGARHGRS